MTIKRRSLPTNIPVPVDPEFERKFIEHGWQRVERIWGKRRTMTWAAVVGKEQLIRKRKEYRAEQRKLRLEEQAKAKARARGPYP